MLAKKENCPTAKAIQNKMQFQKIIILGQAAMIFINCQTEIANKISNFPFLQIVWRITNRALRCWGI